MAIHTLIALLKGEEGVEQYYQNAIEIWRDIVKSDDFHDWDLLLYRIQLEEIRFRHRCGSKYLYKEIMDIVGLMQFYNDYIGFDGTYEDALKVKRAVLESDVTIEVKWFIEKAALQFKLTDDYKPDWEKDNDGHLCKAPEEDAASEDEGPGDNLPY